MPKFYIADVVEENSEIKKYLENVQDDVYDQFNKTTILVKTYAYQGIGADAMKEYLSTVGYNSINHMLNIMENLKELADKEEAQFKEVESTYLGILNTETISEANVDMSNFNISLNECIENANGYISNASEYMSVEQLSNDDIGQSFYELNTSLINLQNEISAMDTTLQAEVGGSEENLEVVNQFINNAISNYFTVSGNVNLRKMDELGKADWNKTAESNVLKDMQKDDPFIYAAGGTGFGYNGDINSIYAEGQFNIDGESNFEIGGAKVREDNIEMDLLNAGASVTANGGWVNGASAQANFFKASTNFGLESEYVNGEIQFDLFTADAYANRKVNSWDDFNIGGAAEANAVSVGVEGSFGSQLTADTGETYSPLNVGFGAGLDVGAGLNLSNEVVGYRNDGNKIRKFDLHINLPIFSIDVSVVY